jgi:hypothetical protein
MTELSPAARAVLDAAFSAYWSAEQEAPNDEGMIAAAALRAAADQVLVTQWEGRIEPDTEHSLGINWTRDALHAIAAELEGADD